MRNAYVIVAAIGWLAGHAAGQSAGWPQLGHDAGRTGRGDIAVAPPFQPRWMWCGPRVTLRNKASDPAWPDELHTGAGKDYPLPAAVDFTFAGRVQPVVAGGTVFAGDMDGRVYAISLADGRTLWTADNAGGTCGSAAVVGSIVVFTSITGAVSGYDAATGATRWRVETPKAVTCSVLAVGENVFAGCHDGRVYAWRASDGKPLWKSEPLGGPAVGDLCGDDAAVYTVSEDLNVSKLDAATGRALARAAVMGQSFRMQHPVLHDGLLFVQTVQGPCVGSEYVMEEVMRDSPDIAAEQQNVLRWLGGDTNGGRWKDASASWRHLHVLRTSDLTSPYVVPNGPADGCGYPAPPPCVDGGGRVLTWFKTAFPTLTAKGSFGTRYSMDVSAIDSKTGMRVPIDNGRLSGTTGETDNLFALSAADHHLYMRQEFRGTKVIDLRDSSYRQIQAAVRTRDGGRWDADVVYRDIGGLPRPSQRPLAGRAAVTIAGGKLLFAEPYGIVCVEHREK